MKFMLSQLTTIIQDSAKKSNTRLLIRFMVILIFFFTVYSILFHFIMAFEGKRYSWITGFYWTLTVMSTLGFGDITFSTDLGRLFSIVVLFSGILFLLIMLPFTFIQFFYAPWLERQNRARTPRTVPDTLSGHIIMTHYDAVTRHLIEKLKRFKIPYVLLISDIHQALGLHEMGFNVVVGELDDPETYRRLRVDHAAMVLVMNDDVISTNIIFTIREVSDKVITVTNADHDDSVDILELAGSVHTFQFTKMLGQVLARRVLGLSMKANIIGRFDELLIAESPVMNSPLQGKTLAESHLREITGVTVVGIWEKGRFMLPASNTRIDHSTVLVLAGSEDQFDRYDMFMIAEKKETLGKKETTAHSHVLVLGGGRVGMSVADTFKKSGIDYRIVEKKRISRNDGKIIQGNAADLDVLIKAGIRKTPSVIITTHDDNLNIFLTIYARQLRPDVQIISRASLDRNINTLHRAGANLVMSFASLCTTTILNLLNPEKMVMVSEGLNIFRWGVVRDVVKKPLIEMKIREKSGCSVIAIKKAEQMIINPSPTISLEQEDELILIGTADAEKAFSKQFRMTG